jgi:hypothetical protein
MQQWGTVTGRIVDENGKPLPPARLPSRGRIAASLFMGNWPGIVTNSDATVGEHPGGQTDEEHCHVQASLALLGIAWPTSKKTITSIVPQTEMRSWNSPV